jgi:hypothetical protein
VEFVRCEGIKISAKKGRGCINKIQGKSPDRTADFKLRLNGDYPEGKKDQIAALIFEIDGAIWFQISRKLVLNLLQRNRKAGRGWGEINHENKKALRETS